MSTCLFTQKNADVCILIANWEHVTKVRVILLKAFVLIRRGIKKLWIIVYTPLFMFEDIEKVCEYFCLPIIYSYRGFGVNFRLKWVN